MLATFRKLALVFGCSLLLTSASWGQTSALEGEVRGDDGQPLQGALIQIERLDIRGNYKVKTNKKGRFFHAGLPLGQYKVTVLVEGKARDTVSGVRTTLGEPTTVDFDLQATKRKQEALQAAAQSGTLTQDQMKGMTREARDALKKQMEQRSKTLSKNKDLNDAFNAAMIAKQAEQWDVAVENFAKAAEIDPEQHVVWANLAESYVNHAIAKRGAEREAAMAKGMETWEKVIALAPENANYHNNHALALYTAGRSDEGHAALEKAIQLNPPGAGQYFFNLGASLLNIDMVENQGAACEAFVNAVEADPNYGAAHFEHGNCLMKQMTMTPDGKPVLIPGTTEAFKKYLDLEPNGPRAAEAQGILQALEATLQTEYTNPDTPERRKVKK